MKATNKHDITDWFYPVVAEVSTRTILDAADIFLVTATKPGREEPFVFFKVQCTNCKDILCMDEPNEVCTSYMCPSCLTTAAVTKLHGFIIVWERELDEFILEMQRQEEALIERLLSHEQKKG